MKKVVVRSDLNKDMSPTKDWLHENDLYGIVFIERPSQGDFYRIVKTIKNGPVDCIYIFHAEFNKDIELTKANSLEDAFRIISELLHEDIYVRIDKNEEFFFIWIPPEHKFYVLFGNRETMLRHYNMERADYLKEIIAFSNENFFSRNTKSYIKNAINEYFTLK